METPAAEEFRIKEVVQIVRDRVGHGSRSSVYEWLPKALVSREPKKFYTKKDVAKLIWFAAVLKQKRSIEIASRSVLHHLQELDESEFISRAFGA